MKHTLGTAAKATGVSRSTVLRAIKSGKISANKDVNGNYSIEPSELHRVFQPVPDEPSHKTALTLHATDEKNAVTAALLEKIELLEKEREREREQLQGTVADLRNRLDQADKERRETLERLNASQEKLTALLTYQPEQKATAAEEPPKKSSLYDRLFNRGKIKT
ncbi:MAG: hypothetical protein PHU14_12510 [Methylovulum sp.]|nr:hypothetical protein [Methylovulum sp.]